MASITLLSTVLILWCTATLSMGLSCDSCGRECAAACGTRNFRTCCFNYLKKRSVDPPTSSGMRLELLMVIPELMEYYRPSLKHLLPPRISETIAPPPAQSSGLQLLYQDHRQPHNYNN